MIQLIVLTVRGVPPAQPLAATFGAAGGTIGRSASNALVLEDPDRTVSRVHVQLLYRDGAFFAVDRGSNPMQHNGRAVGAGNEVPLVDGDRLVVGSFELRAQAGHPDADAAAAGPSADGHAPAGRPPADDDDPFADLLAGLGTPAAAAPVARAAAAEPLRFPDPLESGPSRGASAADPFADLLPPGGGTSGPSGRTPATAGGASTALDDFSDLGMPSASGGGGIDDLFGGTGSGAFGGDPLALSPLADPLAQPNTAASSDPFAALQASARSTVPSRADHLPMDQFAYMPPPAAPAAPATSSASAPRAAPRFDDVTGLPITEDAEAAAPAASAAPATPPRAATGTTGLRASDDELLAALLRGLASTHQPPEMLTPGLMERIGVALRASTEGTLQLLHARQEFKREVRAEVTMIASKANNPLKFSPTVEIALSHLLGPGMRGFMPPEMAMRDAYDDLRAHQFGVMVGMRAALAHVITRFEPAELEKKISARSALDSLFSANRKAKLWDQFVALYGGIATEAEDDFHSLFGKAFVQAYEEQMGRLKAEAPRKPAAT